MIFLVFYILHILHNIFFVDEDSKDKFTIKILIS